MAYDELDNQDVLLAWEYSEEDRYTRSGTWYFVMGAVALGLLLYSLASGNFLFALIVIMAGLVVYLSSTHPAEDVVVAVTDTGILAGGAFYDYSDISHFWFAYEPPRVTSLYLDFKQPWRPGVVLELAEQDPNDVRDVLSVFLLEDLTKDEEPLLDTIGRALKL
jgi:hypothetical protein